MQNPQVILISILAFTFLVFHVIICASYSFNFMTPKRIMTDCLKQLSWPHGTSLSLFLLITFIFKCFLCCGTTLLAIYFVKNFVQDEVNVKTRLMYLCCVGSILFMFVPWPQLIQSLFFYYQYTANENETTRMETSCNLNLQEIIKILRFLYSFFTVIGYGLTVSIILNV